MPSVSRSVLVAHSPARMFALVDAVEDYPQFLPWCAAATVQHRDASRTRATLHIDFRGVRQSFTTDNAKQEPAEMRIALVDGPFRKLEGSWRFTALRDAGCKVELRLHYEFSSALLGRLVGPVFQHIAGTLVEAFVRRAEQTAGAGD